MCGRLWLAIVSLILPFAQFAAAAEPTPTETLIKLTLSPQAAPMPALRHLLLPELGERQPGNQVPAFYKCMFEQNHFYYNQEEIKLREKWQNAPLSEVPGSTLKGYGGAGLKQADYAARLDTIDWQLTAKIKADGVGLLLPDVQVLRNVAGALKVRFRGEVQRKDFDAALVTAKTMFALARMFSEHPTLIGNLVGIAIAQLAVAPLEELISQPGCPNLYWALTQLPAPFIDIQNGFQGERTFIVSEFGGLMDDKAPMSDAAIQKCLEVFKRLASLMDTTQQPSAADDQWVRKRAANAAVMKAARGRLVSLGIPAERLDKMPAVQIIMLDEIRSYEFHRDESLKWTTFPIWQAPETERTDRAGAASPRVDEPNDLLSSLWTPAVYKVRRAQLRLQQRLAMIQTVEAMRLHMAANGGKLPAKLSDVSVPTPNDPATGKPFRFELHETGATLRNTPIPGAEKIWAFNVKYEIAIQK
jgi:hypothetical protein